MAINFSERFNQGREIIAGVGPSKLAVGGVVLAVSTILLLFAMFYKTDESYNVLFSRLAPEDAGAITAELRTKDVPYRLSSDGTTIEVPDSQVASTRIDMATMGLPSKSNVGFEIFDNQKLGVTDMVQKTNLMRAVTGELERTISSLAEVEMARVHLSVPQETIFIEDQKNPVASVAVKLRPGASLTKPQLMGIVNLVAASVNGLSADDISIIDFDGGLIWSKDNNKPGLLNDDQMHQKALFEENIKRRIQAMMERVVGYDRAITTVNAELELTEVITNEDIYDPERTAVRSEQKIEERTMGSGSTTAGIPNATYELGTANRQNAGQGDMQEIHTLTEETNNYEITNIKRQTIASAGDLKKISVAVLLDGVYDENENGELIFAARSPELLKQLEAAVKSTVGFDPTRGDMVSVTSVQFDRVDEVNVWVLLILDLFREYARPFLNLILIVLFFFLVIRPILNWLRREMEPAGSGAEAPVLPEFPGGGTPGSREGLPLPNTLIANEGLSNASETKRGVTGKNEDSDYEYEDSDPNYDEEDTDDQDQVPLALAYGNLTRENILPLARENMDRTVGLVRSWIEEKDSSNEDTKV